MTNILSILDQQVLLADAAMGSKVQSLPLDVETDYEGCENCTEILNRTRPDVIRGIHQASLEAGADAIQTNSFGGSPITLGEFSLADEALALNRRSAEIAREALDDFAGDGRDRLILGSIGPGTRLPSLGHVDYDSLEAALRVQATGLIDGGVDALIIETVQDLLQAKAAINGARLAISDLGRDVPIVVQVTVETTGTLLVGADVAAAATVLRSLDVPIFGLNCATGPQEMAEHVRWLGGNWDGPLSVQPNAGLPEMVDGHTHYPLGPAELAKWLERFVEEDGAVMIGGCCGTTADHIRALDTMLRNRTGSAKRPPASRREVHWVPSIASLYGQVPLRQENAFLMIGERCNANGSKKYREFQANADWDACVAMGREQEREGSHCLDLCTAFVGRDEIGDMTEMVSRLRGAAQTPLVIDSTELPVHEAAMKLYGGKSIVNSINFEDGEAPAAARLKLARKFGAAVIALTIDEDGMAKTADEKVRIAKRLHDFACETHGLPSSDLLIDPLTFTICTGNEDDRKLGVETLDAISAISEQLPACQIILGVSNISFGLKPAARHVLNSVFLDHAVRRGMTGAILHVGKIMPMHQIAEDEVKLAEDLIFDRRQDDYDPLQEFIAKFTDRTAAEVRQRERPESVEERLKQRIIDGDRQGLEEDLDEALQTYPPLDIINIHLLDGMKVVGELFGSGQMQLPFVLQSAETMKASVAHLEPHMERVDGDHKGVIVLATVKGDVHDIGKNLTDIILTNNGYKVVNLGIKQPLKNILEAAHEHNADAIGMSGLLVKSTAIMRENLAEMTRESHSIPVLLGGAALTRAYVEDDCRAAYDSGRVAYARDAFDGLSLMGHVMGQTFDDHLAAETARRGGAKADGVALPKNTKTRQPGMPRDAEAGLMRPINGARVKLRRTELAQQIKVPEPPFWGARLIEGVSVGSLRPYLNTNMLYQFHWGYKKQGRRIKEFRDWAKKELTPVLDRMIRICEDENILEPRAAYGYWPAASEDQDIILFDHNDDRELARFPMPRQNREDGLCIADFIRDVDSGERDAIGLQVVTVGQHASDVARQWFADDRYQDYLYLHGLGVEIAEAMAEYTHKRIRDELGFGHEDSRSMDKLLKQGYRGSRYSFGYPSCPNLHDQRQLLDLLAADRIGVELGEEDQLHPEQSTSAIVLHHPQARYFTI